MMMNMRPFDHDDDHHDDGGGGDGGDDGWLQPSRGATGQTVYSRQSSHPGRRCPTLKQVA